MTFTIAPRSRPGLTLLIGLLVLFIDGYDLFILGTVGPALLHQQSWTVTPATLGMLGSITAVGGAVGAIAAGWAGDLLGRLPLLISLTWVSIWMAASAIAPSVGLFAATRLATGMGVGALIPLVVAVVAETAPAGRRNLWVGIAMTGVAFGGLGAAFAGRTLLGHQPFQRLFLIAAGAIVLLPLAWPLISSDTHIAPSPVTSARSPLPAARSSAVQLLNRGDRRATLLFWAATFLGLVVVYGTSTWLPTLMVKAGYDLNSSLEFLIAFNGGAIIGTLAVTALTDHGGLKVITVACALLAGVAMLVLSSPQTRWLIFATSTAAGLGALGTQNLINAYVVRYHEPRLRGTALGLSLGIGRLGAIAGPIYLSAVSALFTSPKAGFYAFVVPAVLAALVIALIPRRREETDAVLPAAAATASTT